MTDNKKYSYRVDTARDLAKLREAVETIGSHGARIISVVWVPGQAGGQPAGYTIVSEKE